MPRHYKITTLGIIIVFLLLSCSTSKLSRQELSKLASGLTYATIPAAVLNTKQDVKIRYIEAGDPAAPPVILIHGFASSAYTWRHVMPKLAIGYHVFAIDVPGFGFSDKPPDFPYGLEGFGKAVLNFMDQKKIEKTIIVGNSMGGAISLWLTINHPDRVTRLILIDALGYPTKGNAMVSLSSKPWLKHLFGKAVLKMALKQVYYDDKKVTAELVEEYGRPFKTPNAKDVPFWLLKNSNARIEADQSKMFPTIKIPTLIIWGANDKWIPPENAGFFHRDIAGSELLMIPECGHVPQEEKPELVTKAIIEFLAKNR